VLSINKYELMQPILIIWIKYYLEMLSLNGMLSLFCLNNFESVKLDWQLQRLILLGISICEGVVREYVNVGCEEARKYFGLRDHDITRLKLLKMGIALIVIFVVWKFNRNETRNILLRSGLATDFKLISTTLLWIKTYHVIWGTL